MIIRIVGANLVFALLYFNLRLPQNKAAFRIQKIYGRTLCSPFCTSTRACRKTKQRSESRKFTGEHKVGEHKV
ncbi:MAG: hypothetical protein JW793_04850, partial [Acidobacteria bacterium]|nr:hypothetical protein [Acidobacteriota bacterium]